MARRKRSAETQTIQLRDINAATRVITALDLAIAGNDWETIANEAGYGSRGAAHKAVMRELSRRIDARADTLRTMQLARIGRYRTVYYPKAMAGDGWSLDRCLRIDERESALMGLDAIRGNAPSTPAVIEIPDSLARKLRGIGPALPLLDELAGLDGDQEAADDNAVN